MKDYISDTALGLGGSWWLVSGLPGCGYRLVGDTGAVC